MSAADQLMDLELDGGWVVEHKFVRPNNSSGGNFSVGYGVRSGERVGFLKAFDFSEAFEVGNDPMVTLQKLTTVYIHEKELLTECGEKKLSNVVLAIDHGSVTVPNLSKMEGHVYYLIFELATCDARIQRDISKTKDSFWAIEVIKDATLGLWQVHRHMIAHQDIKPSNILVYSDGVSKIADFGRASKRGKFALHDNTPIPGDRTYAPPELLYGFTDPDFNVRRFGCDLYMLGNLIGFMFTGSNVTALMLDQLGQQHHPSNWAGTYAEVLPYLENAFAKLIFELTSKLDAQVGSEILPLVKELCAPNINKRGIPSRIGKSDQYSLERYVSRIDLISKRFEIAKRLKKLVA